jgi:hypothetical protein
MKIDGTPMVRSENSWRSLSKAPPARSFSARRYRHAPLRPTAIIGGQHLSGAGGFSKENNAECSGCSINVLLHF